MLPRNKISTSRKQFILLQASHQTPYLGPCQRANLFPRSLSRKVGLSDPVALVAALQNCLVQTETRGPSLIHRSQLLLRTEVCLILQQRPYQTIREMLRQPRLLERHLPRHRLLRLLHQKSPSIGYSMISLVRARMNSLCRRMTSSPSSRKKAMVSSSFTLTILALICVL
jgi:hypothetical protein